MTNFNDFDCVPCTVSVIGYILILIMVWSEISFYTSSKVTFSYFVDTDMDSKLQIHVDFTVAMPCDGEFMRNGNCC